jgi:hypothetical protein
MLSHEVEQIDAWLAIVGGGRFAEFERREFGCRVVS